MQQLYEIIFLLCCTYLVLSPSNTQRHNNISITSLWRLHVICYCYTSITADYSWPGVRFTKYLLTHDWNLMKIIFVVFLILMIPSGQKFAHVTTAQLLWHVQNFDLIWSSLLTKENLRNFTRFGLWAPKALVKWVPWSLSYWSRHCWPWYCLREYCEEYNRACHLVAITGTTTTIPSHSIQVTTPHLKIRCWEMKSAGTQTSSVWKLLEQHDREPG